MYYNEADVGQAIKESGIPREQIFVTTKLFPGNHGFDMALEGFQESITDLGLDYVDLFLVHWPGVFGADDPNEHGKQRAQSWKALEKLYKEGKCKAIGVSNYMLSHLKQLCESPDLEVIPAVNQCEFHPLLLQQEVVDYCKEKGIVFEGYSPLAKGELLGNEKLLEISQAHKKSPAQVLVKWNLQRGVVVIPKCSSKERLVENTNVDDFELSEAEIAILNGMNTNYHSSWDPNEIL